MGLLQSVQLLDELIEHHRFRFMAQPIYEIGTNGKAIYHYGSEMLAREQVGLPGGGQVPPNILFEMARARGRWAELDEAFFASALSMPTQGLGRLFINLHVDSLMRDSIAELIAGAALTMQSQGGMVVELSEHIPVDDWATVRSRMEELTALGIKFALDDFGAGHANFQAVLDAPMHYVKLDKTLVRDVEKNDRRKRLYNDVVALIRGADIGVVCEGIETIDQYWIAIEAGCHFLQGYYLGRPAAFNDGQTETGQVTVDEQAEEPVKDRLVLVGRK